MDDLISRKAAIDIASGYCHPANIAKELSMLPSAQPETHEERTETHACDCVSRQAAIDFIDAGHLCNPNEPRWSDNEVVNFLKSMPSAQPVLTCKGCKYDYYEYVGCRICLRKERDLYEPER